MTHVRARATRVQVGVLLVLACIALPSPQPTVAQDRTPTPSAKELWESYPLDPSPTRSAEAPAISSPAGARSIRRPPDGAPARSEQAVPIALLALVAFVAALGVMALPMVRRRREVQRQPSRAPAAQGNNGHVSQLDTEVLGTAPVVPPDLDCKWIATIEWRHTDPESRFCVFARAAVGEPAIVIADSDPLEWPPTDPTAVRALGAAAAKLETSLVAAGWKALPPGSEWYAKRFSWEPVVEEPSGSPAARRLTVVSIAARRAS